MPHASQRADHILPEMNKRHRAYCDPKVLVKTFYLLACSSVRLDDSRRNATTLNISCEVEINLAIGQTQQVNQALLLDPKPLRLFTMFEPCIIRR